MHLEHRLRNGWALEGFVRDAESFNVRIVHPNHGKCINASGPTLPEALEALDVAAKPRPANVTLCKHEADGPRFVLAGEAPGETVLVPHQSFFVCKHCDGLFRVRK